MMKKQARNRCSFLVPRGLVSIPLFLSLCLGATLLQAESWQLSVNDSASLQSTDHISITLYASSDADQAVASQVYLAGEWRLLPDTPQMLELDYLPIEGTGQTFWAEVAIDGISRQRRVLVHRASTPGITFATGQHLNMSGNAIINLDDPFDPQDAATKAYVDQEIGNLPADSLGDHSATADLDMNNRLIRNLMAPTVGTDAANKTYVDSASTTGNAATATALAVNGSDCPAGQYPLGVDASGNAVGCTTDQVGSGADNLGDHTATANIQLGNKYLSGDGDDEGLQVDTDGKIGIAGAPGSADLQVGGIDGALFQGTFGSGEIPAEGAGTRFMWYPGKAAIRAGEITGTQWDDVNIGSYSTAFGESSVASGEGSVAIGRNSVASTRDAVALGPDTIASGVVAHAIGASTTASGYVSTATGLSTHAAGGVSTAMGDSTTAESYAEITMGMFDTDYIPKNELAWDATDRLFVIGNGQSPLTRSDALVILKNGDTTLNGRLNVKGNKVTNVGPPTVGTDAANKAYVDGASTTGNAATATALATDGNDCPAGQYARGVDAAGNAQGCSVDQVGSGDNLGDHTATGNIQLGSNWLSGDGGSEGISVDASGKVGVGIAPGSADLLVSGVDGVLFQGAGGSGAIPVEGSGTRLMWYPGKGALRAGTVSGTEWNDNNIGLRSTALGRNTIASGDSSIAFGYSANASGHYSTALGSWTRASGYDSTALGYNTWASGDRSTVFGYGTWASGYSSTAMGVYTTAESGYETVIGKFDTDYVPLSVDGWNASDRLFVIGNGIDAALHSDALVMLKSGDTTLNGHLDVNGDTTLNGDLEVNGEISANAYRYNSTRTGYKFFGPASGSQISGDPVISTGSYIYPSSTQPVLIFISNLGLPDGADLTELKCYFFDDASNADIFSIDARLYIDSLTSTITGFSAARITHSTSGLSSSMLTASDTTISHSGDPVDNGNFRYALEVIFDLSNASNPSSDTRFYGCRIAYELNSVPY